MRRAEPHELTTRAMPAMTAQMSESELLEWVPVPFDDITDPLETPEPSKGALIELDAGGYLVLYYGEDSHQLTVEIPESTRDSSGLLSAFLSEVPLPSSRVLWHRPDITLPQRRRRAASSKTARAIRRVRKDEPIDCPQCFTWRGYEDEYPCPNCGFTGELRTAASPPRRSARRATLPKKHR